MAKVTSRIGCATWNSNLNRTPMNLIGRFWSCIFFFSRLGPSLLRCRVLLCRFQFSWLCWQTVSSLDTITGSKQNWTNFIINSCNPKMCSNTIVHVFKCLSWEPQDWNSFQIRRILHLFYGATRVYQWLHRQYSHDVWTQMCQEYWSSGIVHIFWVGHKILLKLHLTFVPCSASQK